jgi:hypothetical protein
VSHLAASTGPDCLVMVSFMNAWTNEQIADYQPRSDHGSGIGACRPWAGDPRRSRSARDADRDLQPVTLMRPH